MKCRTRTLLLLNLARRGLSEVERCIERAGKGGPCPEKALRHLWRLENALEAMSDHAWRRKRDAQV